MSNFTQATTRTWRVIQKMTDREQRDLRFRLLDAIILAWSQNELSLEIPKGEPHEGEFMDVIVLNDENTIRDYTADMQLMILVASLEQPDVLIYINDPFPPYVNPPNDNEAEAIASTIRETPNLVGLWELKRQGSGSWLLQLVCPNGHTKPTHGTLLVR